MVVIIREKTTIEVILIEAKIDLTLFFEDAYQVTLTPKAIITFNRKIVFPRKCKVSSIVTKTNTKMIIIPILRILAKPTERFMYNGCDDDPIFSNRVGISEPHAQQFLLKTGTTWLQFSH